MLASGDVERVKPAGNRLRAADRLTADTTLNDDLKGYRAVDTMTFEYSPTDCQSFEQELIAILETDPYRGETILNLLETFITTDGASGGFLSADPTRQVYITPSIERFKAEGGYALRISVEGSRIVEVVIIESDWPIRVR